MLEPRFRFMAVLAGLMAVVTIFVCTINELPIRDPDDDVVGPAYVRFPLILLAAVLCDVVPRVVYRVRRRQISVGAAWREVHAERWSGYQIRFLLTGLIGWYVCYGAFRNLKSVAPFVNSTLYDADMARLDRFLWFGHDPAQVLHDLFGTGVAATVLSGTYLLWIAFIPLSLTWALVWTRNHALGAWLVTAIAVVWFFGAITYYAFPTLGPIYSDPATFETLRHTHVTTLQESMIRDRAVVLNDPHGPNILQSIAAFASLHVGLTVAMCLLFHFAKMSRLVRWASWLFLVMTILATVYLGWHFFVDVIGGVVIGAAAVWVAAMGTGNHEGWRPVVRTLSRDQVPSEPATVLRVESGH